MNQRKLKHNESGPQIYKNSLDCILTVSVLVSTGASAISEGDIFIYSCSAQLISFEIESTSKEIYCAEHEYMNMPPSLIALAPLLVLVCICNIALNTL